MRVNAINNTIPIEISRRNINKNNFATEVNSYNTQKVYAHHLGFKGGVPINTLMNDYKWFINCDKTPAIKSFLKLEAPKESMEALLRLILEHEEYSNQFIESLVNTPRELQEIYKQLSAKILPNSELLQLYNPTCVYHTAYEKYMNKRLQEASSISELLKIRPDWSEEILLKKNQELYGNNNIQIGSIPTEIGEENFNHIVKYLREQCQLGMKQNKQIDDLHVNGRTFKFKACIDGKSDKNIFTIETDNGHSYVIKLADPCYKSMDNPFALGTCCKIDSYLTQNACRNSAPLKYYDMGNNVAIYDYIKHSKVQGLYNINAEKSRIKDFTDLGMSANDTVGANNYFLLNSDQSAMQHTNGFEYGVAHNELISVDNDHATYYNALSPRIYGLHKELPNGMLGMFF